MKPKTINQLVDELAGYIARGQGGAQVLVSMASLGDIAGDGAYDRLSAHNWTIAEVLDETYEGFVLLDLATEDGR